MVAFQDIEWLRRCDVSNCLFGVFSDQMVDLVEMPSDVRFRLTLDEAVVAAILPGDGVVCEIVGDVRALSSRLSQPRVAFRAG